MKSMTTLKLLSLMATLPLAASAELPAAVAPGDHLWTGTLTMVNPDAHTLTSKHWGLTRTFRIGEHCDVATLDHPQAAPADLQPGEQVQVRYQNAEGVRIADRITEQPLAYNGRIHSVDAKARTVVMEEAPLYRPFHAPKQFKLTGDCVVTLWNGDHGSQADLHPGDQLSVIYELPGGSPVAYRIEDKSAFVVGTIDALNLPARTLTAKVGHGELTFALTGHCQVVTQGDKHGHLKDLQPGQECRFTYKEVNGVSVLDRVTPTTNPAAPGIASSR